MIVSMPDIRLAVEHADPETGQPLFAGPRVRMGLHWGREGMVVMRQHSITRHKVYGGPAVHITMDVSEAANGGQVLLTDVSCAAAHSA